MHDHAALILLVGVIAIVLVAVCSACANWTTPSLRCALNIVARGGSKQRIVVWAYVWAYILAWLGSAVYNRNVCVYIHTHARMGLVGT